MEQDILIKKTRKLINWQIILIILYSIITFLQYYYIYSSANNFIEKTGPVYMYLVLPILLISGAMSIIISIILIIHGIFSLKRYFLLNIKFRNNLSLDFKINRNLSSKLVLIVILGLIEIAIPAWVYIIR